MAVGFHVTIQKVYSVSPPSPYSLHLILFWFPLFLYNYTLTFPSLENPLFPPGFLLGT